MSRPVTLILGLFTLAGLYYLKPRPSEPSAERAHREPPIVASPFVVAAARLASAAPALAPTASTALPLAHDGPCGPQLSADTARAREEVRSKFNRIAAPPGNATLYFDPSVPQITVQKLLDALAHIDGLISTRLGLSSSAPDVYLYRNAEQLRQGVCVSPRTVSYYDGAIHLAVDPRDDLLNSLKHEYTHHALFSHGLRRPVWFQEGAAMLLGGERQWLGWRPKGALLPIDSMVQTFPQTASAESAEAFYGQAFAMTVFLNELCENSAPCGLPDLVNALASGAVKPEALFDWAVSKRGADLVRTARLPLWDDYVANGLQLSPDTTKAIAARR